MKPMHTITLADGTEEPCGCAFFDEDHESMVIDGEEYVDVAPPAGLGVDEEGTQ